MCCTQVQAANVNTVKAAIVKHSIEMGVDPAITLSIAKTESGFRHEARSSHGAVGVFQLMPSTARRMGLNPYSLDDNIKGPANVKKYRAVPPYKETKRFVAGIMADYNHFKAHPDPAMIAVKKPTPVANRTVVAVQTPKVPAGAAKMVAKAPLKSAPLPVSRFEEARKVNAQMIKAMPMEGELKSQSVAI